MKQSGFGGVAAAFGDDGMRNRDVLFAAGIVGILSILLLPLPTIALDLGLALSLAVSVLILMVSLWIARPLEFSRSEEHTSELQSLMRISYAVFCLKKKKKCHPLSTMHQTKDMTPLLHQHTYD